jgi:hypothetical protein
MNATWGWKMSEPDNDWEVRMDYPGELAWIWDELNHGRGDEPCVDNFRAARIWVSSQRRRFRRMEADGCCGSSSWVAKRWNWRKLRFDIYMLGFNFGH